MKREFRLLTFFSLAILLSINASGQDLGSSNTLFGGKPAKKAPAAASRTPAKRKTTVAKAKPRPRPTSTSVSSKSGKSPKPAKRTTAAVARTTAPAVNKSPGQAVQQTAKVNLPPPVKPPEMPVPTGPAANELFEKLIEDGNVFRDERNYTAAEASYQRASTIKPKDSRAVYGLGNLYSDQQRWEDAENAYRTALRLEANNAIVLVALSYVLSQPIMAPNLSDRYEEAGKFAKRAAELAPSNALAFDQLGVSLELSGIISAETEDAYRRAIRLDGSFAPAYAHLGRLLRRRGMLKASAAAYDDAVKRANDVPTMVLVADVLQSEQRYAESETLLRRAVENDPRNFAGLLLLGKALTIRGNFVDAETFLRRSLDVSPNGFMPNILLGSLYARQGKYEMAENALLQALRFVSPNEKRNLSLRLEEVGDGYMKTGKAKSAARVYKQAITLDTERESLGGKLRKAQHA